MKRKVERDRTVACIILPLFSKTACTANTVKTLEYHIFQVTLKSNGSIRTY